MWAQNGCSGHNSEPPAGGRSTTGTLKANFPCVTPPPGQFEDSGSRSHNLQPTGSGGDLGTQQTLWGTRGQNSQRHWEVKLPNVMASLGPPNEDFVDYSMGVTLCELWRLSLSKPHGDVKRCTTSHAAASGSGTWARGVST